MWIPRCLQRKDRSLGTMSLHTFVNVSENAYGAAVYARCTYEDGSSSSDIVAAKSRVVPCIATGILLLELMGAVIGVRLTSRITEVLDSMNTLWWIRGQSREFNSFVANRVRYNHVLIQNS